MTEMGRVVDVLLVAAELECSLFLNNYLGNNLFVGDMSSLRASHNAHTNWKELGQRLP